MNRTLRMVLALLWMLAAAGAAQAQSRPAHSQPVEASTGKVLQGFEQLSGITVSDGTLTAVTAGEAITEGRQAAQLSGSAAITLQIQADDVRKNAWLKLDTFPVAPLVHAIGVSLTAGGVGGDRVGRVQGGRDTLALPLSTIIAQGQVPDGPVTLTIRNASDSPLILDNLRVEPAAEAPTGASLLDFGPDGQQAWPGFAPAGILTDIVVRGMMQTIYARSAGCPDPLGSDYVGVWPSNDSNDSFTIAVPSKAAATACLWVTHFGSEHSQAAEASVKVNGRAVWSRVLNPQQVMGAKCMLLGIDGDWTPEWFDKTYAPQFVEAVKIPVPPGGVQVELHNCQTAALAVAPNGAKPSLNEWLDQVQKDISRYHRQFVVAARQDHLCDLMPTEDETKSGIMALLPPAAAFGAHWKPEDANRAQTIRAVVANDSLVVVPLALVSLRKGGSVTAAPSVLSTTNGRMLATANGGVETLFLSRVPMVRNGLVEFQPWILKPRGDAKERQIVYAALIVAPGRGAPGGLYKGALRVQIGSDRVDVPMEVEVVELPPENDPDEMVLGALEDSQAVNVCPTIGCSLINDQQRDAFTLSVRTALLTRGGLNSLSVRGPEIARWTATVHTGRLNESMKGLPLAALRGRAVVDASTAMVEATQLHRAGYTIQPLVREAYQRSSSAAQQSRLAQWTFFAGDSRELGGRAGDVPAITALGSVGAKPMFGIGVNQLKGLSADQINRVLKPLGSLLVDPDAPGAGAAIAAFKQLSADKRAYVFSRPDRYVNGFFARAVGADGSYVHSLFLQPSAYDGFDFSMRGLVVPTAEGPLLPTLKALQLRQARADYELMRRVQGMLDKLRKGPGADLAETEKVLAEITAHAEAAKDIRFPGMQLQSNAATPAQIEQWRVSLTRAAGAAYQSSHASAGGVRPASHPTSAAGRQGSP